MRNSVSKVLSKIAKKIAPNYIAGPEVEDAIRICRQIAPFGWKSTICPWDGPGQTPEFVAVTYQKALMAIKKEKFDCYLSIKPPSLNYEFDILKELLDIASENNTRIHFDALSPDTASSSFALLERATKSYKNLGCTLPSCWRRSALDAKRAIELGIAIRIVKGQWPDPVHPDLDPRLHFLELIDVVAGRAVKVAVASHDTSLAKESLIRLQKSGTPCEMEQLFGLPLRIDRVAKPLGINARIYIPYGWAYLPYAFSAVKKRPIILAWVLQDLLAGKTRHLKAYSNRTFIK